MTPADLTGAWRRASIAIGGGPPSEPASVVWLQVGEVYADLRVPLDPAGAQASFAGWTTWEAPTLRWIHDLDLDPSGGDDVGTLDRAGDELVERGTSAGPDGPVPYTEVWRRLPGSGPPHVARRREDGLGLLVRTGAHALAVLDERSLGGAFRACYRTGSDDGWTVALRLGTGADHLPEPPAVDGAPDAALDGHRWLVATTPATSAPG